MNTQSGVVIRRAVAADAAALADGRVCSSVERRPLEPEARDTYLRDCLAFFTRELAREESFLRTWVAVVEGVVVGSATLLVLPTMPRASGAFSGFDGRVRDVYVRPEQRRRGIGGALMREVLAHAREVRANQVTLGASSMGAPLYEKLGFRFKNDEMLFEG